MSHMNARCACGPTPGGIESPNLHALFCLLVLHTQAQKVNAFNVLSMLSVNLACVSLSAQEPPKGSRGNAHRAWREGAHDALEDTRHACLEDTRFARVGGLRGWVGAGDL